MVLSLPGRSTLTTRAPPGPPGSLRAKQGLDTAAMCLLRGAEAELI